MIKIKKIIFFIIKSALILVLLLTLVLFFYSALFYKPKTVEIEIETTENQITKNEKSSDIEEEQRLEETQVSKKASEIEEVEQTSDATQDTTIIEKTEISDALFLTVGNKPITKSDIVTEIKIILILNNESYSSEKRKVLQDIAIKSLIKRNIKQIELEKNNFLNFNEQDFQKELVRLANNINLDLKTLKNVCASNDVDFSIIEDQIKSELLWNGLVFQLYKDRISINPDEIEEKLKLMQNNKNEKEYLISEILVRIVEKEKLEDEIKQLKSKIKTEGFENVAKNLSITNSAKNGGDLGWLNENIISEKIKSAIADTAIGNLSKPIILPEGILIFKIRDKREKKINIIIEEAKNQLVTEEKSKLLQMYSLSHYDKLRRLVSINFFND